MNETKKLRAYISHRISDGGKDGQKTQQEHCQEAIEFGKELRVKFPTIEFYIPAESEPFVGRCYEFNLLTIDNILDIDCEILMQRDFLINFVPDGYISKGMSVENKAAGMCGMPIFDLKDSSEEQVAQIHRYLDIIMKG